MALLAVFSRESEMFHKKHLGESDNFVVKSFVKQSNTFYL